MQEVALFAGGDESPFRAGQSLLDAVVPDFRGDERDRCEQLFGGIDANGLGEGVAHGVRAVEGAEAGENDDAPPGVREQGGRLGRVFDVWPRGKVHRGGVLLLLIGPVEEVADALASLIDTYKQLVAAYGFGDRCHDSARSNSRPRMRSPSVPRPVSSGLLNAKAP